MPSFDVVGLGVSTIDIVTLVDRFPSQEAIQRALDMAVQGGGPVATAIVALARLGARTAMLDVVGDDWRGGLITSEFAREGVCTDHLVRPIGHTSATACVLVRRSDGARTILYLPGSTPELMPDNLPQAVIQSSRALHVNGRHWLACLHACEWARQAGVLVSFDGGADRYRPEMQELVPLTDLCIVARDFAQKYTGQADLDHAGRLLLEQGPQIVVITDGTRGSWVFPAKEPSFHQPAYLVPDVVDTTGCGDTYHGAFLFGVLQGWSLTRTAAFASGAAALNARHLGGRGGLPTADEVEAFLRQQTSAAG